MNGFIGIIVVLFLIVAGFSLTKALWQWILGTGDILNEAKKQTKILEEIRDRR